MKWAVIIAIIGALLYVLDDGSRYPPKLSTLALVVATPANGYCNPEMPSCGYDGAKHGGKIDADFYAWLENNR